MKRERRLGEFRVRLLVAFGVGSVPGLLIGDEVEAGREEAVCFGIESVESACPTGEEAMRRLEERFNWNDDGPELCVERTLLRSLPGHPADPGDPNDLDSCCYMLDVEYTCERQPCGCYGRPYVDEERVVSAPVIGNRAWGDSGTAKPELADLDGEQRAALAEFWSDAARAEHSSIAGFHRFALDLFAHGAPPELLDRCIRAAADELAHARICFALASHYAGEALGPGPMPLGDSAPIARDLVELAIATARDGCLGETSAAWLASETAERATDPVVRAALERIAHEEAEHAELAWMTLRWALEVGGAKVRAAVAEVFAHARATPIPDVAVDVPGHGLLDARETRAIVEQGFEQLLVPLMHAAVFH